MSLLEQLAAEASQNIETQTATEETIETTANATEETQETESAATQEAASETTETEQTTETTSTETEETTTQTNVQETEQEKPANKGSRFANEELQRFNEFVLKTGKSWEDFQALNKPTDQLDSKDLLKQYYSEKEGMTEKEIDYELSSLIVDENSDDFDFEDEKTTLKREVLLERELRKAREWRETYVTEALSALDTPDSENMTIEDYQAQVEEQKKLSVDEYRQQIYSALPEVKTMEVTVDGEKMLFTPDEAFDKQLKTVTEDFGTVVNKYYDKSGKLIDAAGWIDLVSWADETTRNAKIKFMIDQAILKDRAGRSKERRNVNNTSQTAQTNTAPNEIEAFEDWRSKKNASALG